MDSVRVDDGRGDGRAEEVGRGTCGGGISARGREGRAALKGDGGAAHRVLPLPRLEGGRVGGGV